MGDKMNFICLESNNIILTICGIFYSVLCIFSIVTGLMYALGKRKLNPIELSENFVSKLKENNKLESFSIKMGWITFIVGLFQGICAFSIFYGYNTFLNYFAIFFTIFSICSVVFKLIKKINAFSFLKLIAYILILLVLIVSGMRKYGATSEALKYIETNDMVNVNKIKEGYYFDGPGESKAIIFYPGASVQYTAYSKLMYKLAFNGFDTFLLSMPLNFALLDINAADKIINKYDYSEWYLSGHSLGGVAACTYASSNPDKVCGVISLASYPNEALPENIKYISIYGTEDKVLNSQSMDASMEYLPDESYVFVIDGANHAYFGDYGNQNGDGDALITNEEQQNFVVNKLLEMLN